MYKRDLYVYAKDQKETYTRHLKINLQKKIKKETYMMFRV